MWVVIGSCIYIPIYIFGDRIHYAFEEEPRNCVPYIADYLITSIQCEVPLADIIFTFISFATNATIFVGIFASGFIKSGIISSSSFLIESLPWVGLLVPIIFICIKGLGYWPKKWRRYLKAITLILLVIILYNGTLF